jgi:hypothetical protein
MKIKATRKSHKEEEGRGRIKQRKRKIGSQHPKKDHTNTSHNIHSKRRTKLTFLSNHEKLCDHLKTK